MSTLIAVYKFGSKATDELKSCTQALLAFYGVIALVLMFLLVLEAHFGMFDGLSAAQALLKATGMDLMPEEFVSIL
jgi:hypothetical protein